MEQLNKQQQNKQLQDALIFQAKIENEIKAREEHAAALRELLQKVKKEAINLLEKENNPRSKKDKAILEDAKSFINDIYMGTDKAILEALNAIYYAHDCMLDLHANHESFELFKHYRKERKNNLEKLFLDGANNWQHFSISGNALVYDVDIAAHYWPSSVAKKLRQTYKGESLIYWQGVYLNRSSKKAIHALTHNKKTWELLKKHVNKQINKII